VSCGDVFFVSTCSALLLLAVTPGHTAAWGPVGTVQV
jgi:hypothetical protein